MRRLRKKSTTRRSSTARRRDADTAPRTRETSERKARSPRSPRRPLRRARLPRWLLPLVVFGAVGFLYVRPITTYLDTREQLTERRTEVATLRAERARVTARLERATSLEQLARDARRIGYVRPEEHLFIVKGTAAWSRKHSG